MNHYQRRALQKKRRPKTIAGMTVAMLAELNPDQLEKAEQWEVVKLYEAVGCKVISFSQPRATMQTEGIPDLRVYCERKGLSWWQECKRPNGGRQSDAQLDFQIMAERCGEIYILGGFREAYAHLQQIGVILL